MSQQLDTFVTTCPRSPAAVLAVRQFVQRFLAGLTPADRSAWTRTRVIAEMVGAGFAVGLDENDRATFIGIGLNLRVVMAGWPSPENLQAPGLIQPWEESVSKSNLGFIPRGPSTGPTNECIGRSASSPATTGTIERLHTRHLRVVRW